MAARLDGDSIGKRLGGELLIAGDSGWDEARGAFNVTGRARPRRWSRSSSATTAARWDVSTAFTAATASRLRAAKRKYDPENLFHASHLAVTA
jgi:hypothetical protein